LKFDGNGSHYQSGCFASLSSSFQLQSQNLRLSVIGSGYGRHLLTLHFFMGFRMKCRRRSLGLEASVHHEREQKK
jgi:hypothetical protein